MASDSDLLDDLQPISPAEAVQALKREQGKGDTEAQHAEADRILCRLLLFLGCEDAVREWRKVNKWYA